MTKPASQPAHQLGAQPTPKRAATPGQRPVPPNADVDKVLNRLKRIEGQARGLQRMVAGRAPCEDILTQLSATRAALDRVGILLITHKVRECLRDESDASSEAAIERALETFQRYAQHLQTLPGADPLPGVDPRSGVVGPAGAARR